MKSINYAGFAVASLAAALFYASPNKQPETAAIALDANQQTVSASAATTHDVVETMTGSLASPFRKGPPPTPRTAEQRALERKAIMESNRYSTPPEYFKMSLSELQTRAKQKDIFALLQLGQQYWYENEDIATDPAYDKSISPKENAIKQMSAAAGQGHSHAATVVSDMYENQGSELQAYSWILISEQMGDSTLLAQRVAYENRLSAAQRNEALSLATTKYAEIQSSILEMLKTKTSANK